MGVGMCVSAMMQHRARRQDLNWLLLLVLLLICSVHTLSVNSLETSCRGENGCVNSANKRDTSSTEQCLVPGSNPMRIEESVFRTTQIMRGTEAVDLCFVVSTSNSMSDSQVWLQMAVPVLDAHLRTLGIGTGEQSNRYCLAMFGGSSSSRFIQVSGETFFPYNQFYHARRQLSRTSGTGAVADGYEAIDFTVNNAPFREHPNVVKIIVLVTDSDRARPPVRSDFTRDSILEALHSRHIVMDTVVSISLQVVDPREGVVLGYHGYREASILRPNGSYEMSHNQSVQFTHSEGETIADYVSLSLALGSSSWPLGLLNNEDYHTILSFASAFANVHGLFPALPVEVCERCVCGRDSRLSCDMPENQTECRCLIDRSATQCGVVMPTPTTTYITSYLAPTATPNPVAIEIEGHVSTLRDGDTVIFFASNYPLATYQCILMPDGMETPIINPCTSPYQVSTPTPGRYSLLVLAHYQGQRSALLLWFEVLPPSGRLEVTIIQQSITSNESVLVEFAANRLDVQFMCSNGEERFELCTSPHLIPPRMPGLREEVFIVLATDSDSNGAASVLKIEDPTLTSPTTEAPGPVMIEVLDKLYDPDGVTRFRFRPTRNDVTCICRVDDRDAIICFNRTTGMGEYRASPDVLGTGLHNLKVTCMDDDSYATTSNIKFTLIDLPLAPPPTESLQCNLQLLGPNDRGILSVHHSCNRPVTSLCQVSRLPPTPCGGSYEFDTSPLGPGNHEFVLVVEDGYEESIMKFFPFFIETAQRRCCPLVSSNQTTVSVESDMLVHLHVSVAPGNCSLNEGFSYTISWGDSARESGTKIHLSHLHSSRQYSVPGDYIITTTYCNNPAAVDDKCCSSVISSVNFDSSEQT